MKKLILFIGLIILSCYSNINAQVCICNIKTFDETIHVADGTQAIGVYAGAFTFDPTIVSYRLERVDANNNAQVLTSVSASIGTISSLYWRDVSFPQPASFFQYRLIGVRSFNATTNVASTTHFLLPPNNNLNCVKLNQLYRKACHNCYDEGLVPSFTSALFATKVVEIDIYAEDPKDKELSLGTWQVRHTGNQGNENNCGSGNQNFDVCLDDAINFHNAFPNHDPILIYVDLKRNLVGGNFWKQSHRPHHLDQVLDDVGIENIYTPSDLKGSFAQLRFAAEDQNWPTLAELRGKFIFVLTGKNSELNTYLNELQGNGLAFVAPKVKDENPNYNELIHPGDGLGISNEQHVVFYNLTKEQLGLAREFMPKHGFISRVYEGTLGFVDNTTGQEYGEYVYRQVNNIAISNLQGNFFNVVMNDKLLETNITNVVLGVPPSTMFIDSKYDHITQHALQTVTTHNLKVLPGTHYNISAGQEVDLLPGTDIQEGANTDIFISNCEDYVANMRVNPFANQEQGRTLTQQEIDWMLKSSKTNNGQTTTTLPLPQPVIFPNPTTGNLTISQLEQFAGGNLTITNVLGQVVLEQQINATTLNISLAHQPKGIYLVKISGAGQSVVQKVVLE